MSRTLYDALSQPVDPDPWADEADAPSPLLRAFAAAARVRRVARELAEAEYQEGIWVEDERGPGPTPVRLAAHDARLTDYPVTYASGAWRVRLSKLPTGGVVAEQLAGPAGGTLVFGRGATPERYVPLDRGGLAAVPGVGDPPAMLELMDAMGGWVTLAVDG